VEIKPYLEKQLFGERYTYYKDEDGEIYRKINKKEIEEVAETVKELCEKIFEIISDEEDLEEELRAELDEALQSYIWDIERGQGKKCTCGNKIILFLEGAYFCLKCGKRIK